jgi:hypothetical protein
MLDPRMFLGIQGPVGPQALQSGFRPPGPGPGAPMMQPPQMQMPGVPMMGLGMKPHDPTKPGVPTAGGDPTGGAGPAYLGGTSPLGGANQPVDPNTIGASAQPGSFMTWLRGLF